MRPATCSTEWRNTVRQNGGTLFDRMAEHYDPPTQSTEGATSVQGCIFDGGGKSVQPKGPSALLFRVAETLLKAADSLASSSDGVVLSGLIWRQRFQEPNVKSAFRL